MHYKKIVVIDTETTGLKKKDRIIEIACLTIKKNKINDTFHTYLYNNRKISKESFKLHKIKKKKLKNKPEFKDVHKKLDKILKNNIIVAHNAKFDLKFLKREYAMIGKYRKFKYIDTLNMAKKIFPGKKNSIKNLSKRLKIKNYKKMHRAINDANILAKIYLKFKNIQKKFS
ncbi:3'-5' exonuclease [Candidatus Vidania fulgoroideorum]